MLQETKLAEKVKLTRPIEKQFPTKHTEISLTLTENIFSLTESEQMSFVSNKKQAEFDSVQISPSVLNSEPYPLGTHRSPTAISLEKQMHVC